MAFNGTPIYATITNPGSAQTDYSAPIDLSLFNGLGWWSQCDTSDFTKIRVSKGDKTTELAFDPINVTKTGADTGTGLLRVKWAGTLASTGIQQVYVYPALAANSSYGVSDTYGQYNAYGSNIKAYYPLQSDGNDRTGNQYNLTAFNSPAFTSGVCGNMASLNGTNQYFAGSYSPITDQPCTIMAHFQTTSSDGAVIGLYDASDSADWWSISISGTNARVWDRLNGPSYIDSSLAVNDGNNHYLGGYFYFSDTRSRATLYIDGNSYSATTSTNDFALLFDVISIGRDGDSSPGNYFGGGISHCLIYDTDVTLLQDYEKSAVLDNATFWGTWTLDTPGGAISGLSEGTSTATATIEATGDLSGLIEGSANLSGILSAGGRLYGTISGLSEITGTIHANGALSGQSDGIANISGTILGIGELSGLIEGNCTVEATLSAITDGSISGLSEGTCTVTGLLRADGELIGEISGDCTVSGTLRDASSVIVGKITVTLTANIPGITLSGNSANIELSGNKPVITFSEG